MASKGFSTRMVRRIREWPGTEPRPLCKLPVVECSGDLTAISSRARVPRRCQGSAHGAQRCWYGKTAQTYSSNRSFGWSLRKRAVHNRLISGSAVPSASYAGDVRGSVEQKLMLVAVV